MVGCPLIRVSDFFRPSDFGLRIYIDPLNAKKQKRLAAFYSNQPVEMLTAVRVKSAGRIRVYSSAQW